MASMHRLTSFQLDLPKKLVFEIVKKVDAPTIAKSARSCRWINEIIFSTIGQSWKPRFNKQITIEFNSNTVEGWFLKFICQVAITTLASHKPTDYWTFEEFFEKICPSLPFFQLPSIAFSYNRYLLRDLITGKEFKELKEAFDRHPIEVAELEIDTVFLEFVGSIRPMKLVLNIREEFPFISDSILSNLKNLKLVGFLRDQTAMERILTEIAPFVSTFELDCDEDPKWYGLLSNHAKRIQTNKFINKEGILTFRSPQELIRWNPFFSEFDAISGQICLREDPFSLVQTKLISSEESVLVLSLVSDQGFDSFMFYYCISKDMFEVERFCEQHRLLKKGKEYQSVDQSLIDQFNFSCKIR